MKQSKVFQLICTLQAKEIKEINLLLDSPYFNKREEVKALFKHLVKYIPKPAALPDKSIIFQQIKGKKVPFKDQDMRLWMSFLFKLLEKYLVLQSLEKDPVTYHQRLSLAYGKRQLPKHQERQLRNLSLAQEQSPLRNAAHFEHRYNSQMIQHRFATTDQRMPSFDLQNINEPLDTAYAARKLQQACVALSQHTVYKMDYQPEMVAEVLAFVQRKSLFKIPAVAVYYYGYQLLVNPADHGAFFHFKDNLVQHQQLFPKEELGNLYLLGINFCIKKYNEGERAFLEDELELYQQGLQQNLFLKNNQLSRFTYRNVVTLGLIQGQYDWVETFIHTYRSHLDRQHRIPMFSFCQARLAYHRQQYGEALGLLQKTSYRDVLLNLAAKTVMLKIFYELNEYELLQAHLDAMRTFIRRKKVMGYHRENYVNLIYWTRKLIERNPFDPTELEKIRSHIETTKVIAEKDWLISRAQ